MSDNAQEYWEQRQVIKTELTHQLWDNGIPISSIVFQLSVEDVLDVLSDMVIDGKFDKDDPDVDLFAIIGTIQDDLEDVIDWRTSMKACLFAYMFGVGIEKAARLQREQEEAAE